MEAALVDQVVTAVSVVTVFAGVGLVFVLCALAEGLRQRKLLQEYPPLSADEFMRQCPPP